MEDYVQLITKLLADKEELTATIEHLETRLATEQKNPVESDEERIHSELEEKNQIIGELEQRNRKLENCQKEAKEKVEELTRDRDEHISKTKQQIDDFLQIIEQYE